VFQLPTCPQCGNTVSPDEIICPFCGYRIGKEEVKRVFEEEYEEKVPPKPALTKLKLLFISPRETFKDLAYFPENTGTLLILLTCTILSTLTLLAVLSHLNMEINYIFYISFFFGGFFSNFVLYIIIWLFLSLCYWIPTRLIFGKISYRKVSAFLGYALITLIPANLIVLILALIIVPRMPSETSPSGVDMLTLIQEALSIPPFNIYHMIFVPFLIGTGILYAYGVKEEFKISFAKALVFSIFTTFLVLLFVYELLYF